jgi:hypothetical protein
VGFCVQGATAQAQPNWDRYRPARLDTGVQNHRHLLDVTYDAALDSRLYVQLIGFWMKEKDQATWVFAVNTYRELD